MVTSSSPSVPSLSPPMSPPPPNYEPLSYVFYFRNVLTNCIFKLCPHNFRTVLPSYFSCLYNFFSSSCSSPYVRDNSQIFSGLLPAHSFLRTRHPLQIALSPLKISNALCPLPLWHCFFSTDSTTISSHAIPWFLVVKCPPHFSYYCFHTPHNKYSYP